MLRTRNIPSRLADHIWGSCDEAVSNRWRRGVRRFGPLIALYLPFSEGPRHCDVERG